MYIHISRWFTLFLWHFSFVTVIRWHRLHSGLDSAECGEGAAVPLGLQWVCGIFALPLWQGRQPSIWFSWTSAGCYIIAASTLICPGNTTQGSFCSRTLARGFMISCCLSSIAVRDNLSFAILAILKARRKSDCSSCTRPPCPTIVADMFKTYKTLVAASRVTFGWYLNQILLCSLL